MKIRNNKLIKFFPVIIFFVSLIMSVGYASINSFLINFSGESFAFALKGIYITSIEQVENGSTGEVCTMGTTDNLCSEHYSGRKFTNTSMSDGNASMPNPFGTTSMVGKTGNSYARITLIKE